MGDFLELVSSASFPGRTVVADLPFAVRRGYTYIMTPRQIHTHCSYCGIEFENLDWPRRCLGCTQVTYRNPLPVACLVVPVGRGVLTVRRGIEPKSGMLTFPGGFIDYGESWQQAAVRELWEEAGIVIPPEEVRLYDAISTSKGHMVTIVGIVRSRTVDELEAFVPTEESTECVIIEEPVELAFPQDDQIAKRYFREREGR